MEIDPFIVAVIVVSVVVLSYTFKYIRSQKSSESLAIETGETVSVGQTGGIDAAALENFKFKHLFFTFPERERFGELLKQKAFVPPLDMFNSSDHHLSANVQRSRSACPIDCKLGSSTTPSCELMLRLLKRLRMKGKCLSHSFVESVLHQTICCRSI